MTSTMLQVAVIALICSLTSINPTNAHRSQLYSSYYPFYYGQELGRGPPMLMPPAAISPPSILNDGDLQAKGLGVIDLVFLAKLTARLAKLEKTVNNLGNGQDELPAIKSRLTTVESKLSTVQGTLSTTTSKVTTLETDVESLQGDVTGISSDVESVQLDVSNMEGVISNLHRPTTINGMPSSCNDLRDLGNFRSGLYNIYTNNNIASVYCDFLCASDDSDIEKFIGYIDVKTIPTYFALRKSINVGQTNAAINFENEFVNIGNSYNMSENIFVAPCNGVYYFTFTATVAFGQASTSINEFTAKFIMDSAAIVAYATLAESNTQDGQKEILHLEMVQMLQTGQTIAAFFEAPSDGALLGDSSSHFSGMLLWQTNLPS